MCRLWYGSTSRPGRERSPAQTRELPPAAARKPKSELIARVIQPDLKRRSARQPILLSRRIRSKGVRPRSRVHAARRAVSTAYSRGLYIYCLSYTATIVTSFPWASLVAIVSVHVLPSGEITFCATATTRPAFFHVAFACFGSEWVKETVSK